MSLLLFLFLKCCSCFVYFSFFYGATCIKASFKFLKSWTSFGLFCFQDLFDGYDTFVFAGFLTKYKGIVVVESFEFHVDSMQPGELDVIIEFENGFEGLRFRKVFVY